MGWTGDFTKTRLPWQRWEFSRGLSRLYQPTDVRERRDGIFPIDSRIFPVFPISRLRGADSKAESQHFCSGWPNILQNGSISSHFFPFGPYGGARSTQKPPFCRGDCVVSGRGVFRLPIIRTIVRNTSGVCKTKATTS